MIDVVLIRGGARDVPAIAEAAGMRYGVRHDYTPYGDVFMLDIRWDKYEWRDYLAKVKAYRPVAAMAPDYQHAWQWTTLQRQIDDLRALGVPRILVCPKWGKAAEHIPLDCVIAISVPAPTYAGYLPPDLTVLNGRRVHLLGGKPEKQAEYIQKLAAYGAQIISTDGNYHVRKAGLGQWFDGGQWVQLRRKSVSDFDLAVASSKNIVRYLNDAAQITQPSYW